MEEDRPHYRFKAFGLWPSRQRLLRDGAPVPLGSRALALLLVLVEQHGRMVSKQALLDAVWPDDDVIEANLAVHVSALRKQLGQDAIVTVAGRGYRFAWPVHVAQVVQVAEPGPTAHFNNAAAPHDRSAEQGRLLALLAHHRLVTLVGAAGVGKTWLARRCVQALPPAHEGPWWVDLAPLASASAVVPALAQVLKVTLGPARDATAAVAAALRQSPGPALLVLDNAEHVLDGVAALAVALHLHAPGVHVLVTSQQPLHLAHEQVLPLEPMSLPQDTTLQSVQASGAGALFVACARRQGRAFALDASNCAAVADICTRLDGIPLALEFAAARLPLLGVTALRDRLHERLALLAAPARGHPPRHHTLRAALEWSWGLLSPREQTVLRRLSVFTGSFAADMAEAVLADGTFGPGEALALLAALTEKSLLVSSGGEEPRLRLLETTRLFAAEQLLRASEAPALREQHARALADRLTVVHDDHRMWRTPPLPPGALRAELEDTRAALDFAATCDDDTLVLRLAAGSGHVMLACGLNAEYLERVVPLAARIRDDTAPTVAAALWSRLALASSRNGHGAGFGAAQRAAALYREVGDPGRCYDALTWALAIGARRAEATGLEAMAQQALALEHAAWPAAHRSSLQWALYRWHQSRGEPLLALACAERQAALLGEAGVWIQHVALGANVADCEIALGRPERAEALSRRALVALDADGIAENIVGHVMDAHMLALTLLGRLDEALVVGRRARRLLEREGDEARLLEALALHADRRGNLALAAGLVGAADTVQLRDGERRWPAAAQRRQALEQRLANALGPRGYHQHHAAGTGVPLAAALDLGLGLG